MKKSSVSMPYFASNAGVFTNFGGVHTKLNKINGQKIRNTYN